MASVFHASQILGDASVNGDLGWTDITRAALAGVLIASYLRM